MREAEERMIFQNAVDRRLSGLQENPFLAQRIMNQERTGEPVVKKRLSIGLVLAIILMMITVTALAVALLSPKEIVEQVAVPMAQENDHDETRQEFYTHDELAQLIQTLGENGFTIDENTTIIQAFKNGYGYWEDEVLMEICRSAFGSNEEAWSVDQKYWVEYVMDAIGIPDQHIYLQPDESDMTEEEAARCAAGFLNEEYGANLPSENDDIWLIYPYLFAPMESADGIEPATWEFRYVNRATGVIEYIVRFLRNGELVDSEEAGFHGTAGQADSFSSADRLIGDKYGSKFNMPMEGWVEFGQMISGLTPTRTSEWCYQHAGYCMPPEQAIAVEDAVRIVCESLDITGNHEDSILCCIDGDTPIYKVNLRFQKADQTGYAAIWCAEVDCMTGVILRIEPYNPATSPMLMQFVPFSVLEAAPEYESNNDEASREAANLARREAYERYEAQYQTMWYFWPLEAQKESLGPHHDIPQGNEMTRDQAAETAICAVRERYGQTALDRLGDWQTGVICCRYPEDEGVRVVWEIYITSDTVTISNGYRVTFDDPAGVMMNPEIEIFPANNGNG